VLLVASTPLCEIYKSKIRKNEVIIVTLSAFTKFIGKETEKKYVDCGNASKKKKKKKHIINSDVIHDYLKLPVPQC